MSKLGSAWRMCQVAMEPNGIRAIRTWKPFSITSFHMMRALAQQGLKFRTIIDGGANIGQFARAATETFPDARVYSFEPLPDVSAVLRQNLASRSQVKIIQAALGSEDGKIPFHRAAYSLASSALPIHAENNASFAGVKEVETIEVDLFRLDTVLAKEPLESPCLLKLDLQGFELEALKGATQTLKRCDYVLLETALKTMYEGEALFDEIYDFMRQSGYHFLRPVDFLKDAKEEIVQLDALFARK